jgi:thioredoxin 1
MTEFYYFSTAWCQPCRAFKPVVQQVIGELGVPMQFLDAEQNPDLAQKFSVTSVPTIIVAQGGQPIYRNIGVISKAQLTNALGQFR